MGYRRQRIYPARIKSSKVRPRGQSRNYSSSKKDTYPVAKKILISLAIFLSVFLLKNIDRPLPQKMIDSVRMAVTQDFDMKESLGKLKFVQKYSPKLQSTFSLNGSLWQDDVESPDESLSLILPAKGKIVGTFSETGGLDIEGKGKLEVLGAANGEIILIDDHAKGYAITIRHSEDLVTVYHNITQPYIEKGTKVRQGDIIGLIDAGSDKNPILHFTVWKNDNPIDPNSLLQQAK